MIMFIIDQARRIGILSTIIKKKDNIGQTPFYLLCVEGYRKRPPNQKHREKEEHLKRHEVVKFMVESLTDLQMEQEVKLGENSPDKIQFRKQLKMKGKDSLDYWNSPTQLWAH